MFGALGAGLVGAVPMPVPATVQFHRESFAFIGSNTIARIAQAIHIGRGASKSSNNGDSGSD